GFGQKHGNVETVGETLRRLDGNFVTAVDQCDSAALERHQRDRWHVFAGRGNQRGCFWAGYRGVLRPAAGLADVDEGELGFWRILRDFPKQRRFLGAGNRDRCAVSERLLELVEVEAAKLVGLRDPGR